MQKIITKKNNTSSTAVFNPELADQSVLSSKIIHWLLYIFLLNFVIEAKNLKINLFLYTFSNFNHDATLQILFNK